MSSRVFWRDRTLIYFDPMVWMVLPRQLLGEHYADHRRIRLESLLELLHRRHVARLERGATGIRAGLRWITLHLETNGEELIHEEREWLRLDPNGVLTYEERDDRESHRHRDLCDDDDRPHPAELRSASASGRAPETLAQVARDTEPREHARDRSGQDGQQCGVDDGQR